MSVRLSLAVLSLALSVAPAVRAQPAAEAAAPPAASFTVPRAYAGYAQPEITQCTTTGDSRRECIVPAMTAGRYLIVARDNATSTGADATQQMQISLNGQPCQTIKSQPFTGKKALPAIVCEVTFLTDAPITITATFTTEHATADPGGPKLVIRRVPWNGIIDARGGALQPRPATAPAK
ncbi:MAG TPA: hypothetical protein VKU90_12365 [Caulobacteraceae bacterium]|nr:hypothetical protein [Caulobacteraceae bacterium]